MVSIPLLPRLPIDEFKFERGELKPSSPPIGLKPPSCGSAVVPSAPNPPGNMAATAAAAAAAAEVVMEVVFVVVFPAAVLAPSMMQFRMFSSKLLFRLDDRYLELA